jgi:hypothetical protein
MKTIPWDHDKNLSKTLSFPWRDAVQEGTSPRLKGNASQGIGCQTCKMSVFNPKRHPTAPIKWDKSQRGETIHDALREFSGAYATCLVSLRAFSNPGFRHDRAALRRVNWTSAGTVYTKAFLYLNPAAVVRRGAYLSAHPEQLRKVVCFDLLKPSNSHAPSPVPSPVREEMSIWESWRAA